MITKKILIALEELERWKRRKDQLISSIKNANSAEKQKLKRELDKVNEQIEYYEALVKDMKKELRPVKITDVIE